MILAIDLGSTSFKAGLFNGGLDCIGSGTAELICRCAPGGVAELDPEQVAEAVRQAVAGALSGAEIPSLTAVAITSQAHTFTVTDERFKPLTPFLSWLDVRAAAACSALQQDDSLVAFPEHCSFPEILPGLQICKLRHLNDTLPGGIRADSRIVFLPSFVLNLLSGENVCDRNMAAMSGLYSMKTGDWWPAALAACGICAGNLPSLVDAGTVAGWTTEAAARFGLPAGLPVILAGNDQTAGAYGAELHRNKALLITLGTCQVAYMVLPDEPSPRRSVAAGPYLGGRWYALAAGRCGGMQINWAKTILAGCGTDALFDQAAAAAPAGCHGLIFELGKNVGEGVWMDSSINHKPGDFARSVLEALVANMMRLADGLTGGRIPETVLVAGGGSRSALWTTLLSEALGRPLTVTAADPLRGAACMARDAVKKSKEIKR